MLRLGILKGKIGRRKKVKTFIFKETLFLTEFVDSGKQKMDGNILYWKCLFNSFGWHCGVKENLN